MRSSVFGAVFLTGRWPSSSASASCISSLPAWLRTMSDRPLRVCFDPVDIILIVFLKEHPAKIPDPKLLNRSSHSSSVFPRRPSRTASSPAGARPADEIEALVRLRGVVQVVMYTRRQHEFLENQYLRQTADASAVEAQDSGLGRAGGRHEVEDDPVPTGRPLGNRPWSPLMMAMAFAMGMRRAISDERGRGVGGCGRQRRTHLRAVSPAASISPPSPHPSKLSTNQSSAYGEGCVRKSGRFEDQAFRWSAPGQSPLASLVCLRGGLHIACSAEKRSNGGQLVAFLLASLGA